jgi:hypothetical protein
LGGAGGGRPFRSFCNFRWIAPERSLHRIRAGIACCGENPDWKWAPHLML